MAKVHHNRRVSISFDQALDRTKQSFKDECNINKIMEKFQRTGAIDHYARHGASYGDASHIELHDALNIVADAETMFEELPSKLRKKFSNDPEQFLEFVNDKKNLAEMQELGLAAKTTPIAAESSAKGAEIKPATKAEPAAKKGENAAPPAE